jgi:hypothetical protein
VKGSSPSPAVPHCGVGLARCSCRSPRQATCQYGSKTATRVHPRRLRRPSLRPRRREGYVVVSPPLPAASRCYIYLSAHPSAAILHTIFFHRYFTSISPLTRDLLDLTLPAIDDVDLETLIDQRTAALVRAIESTHQQRGRGQLVVQFFEKKRRKTYFFGKADEEVCWEAWTLDVTCATPRTETGMLLLTSGRPYSNPSL